MLEMAGAILARDLTSEQHTSGSRAREHAPQAERVAHNTK
jgi:hypothetical protein